MSPRVDINQKAVASTPFSSRNHGEKDGNISVSVTGLTNTANATSVTSVTDKVELANTTDAANITGVTNLTNAANKRRVLIDIQHVTRIYQADDDSATHALEDVSLTVREGEFVSLIGPSGCGKTTLLRLVAGLDTPQAGTLTVANAPIEGPSYECGYVFQQGALYPWATVADNIATGLKARGVYRQQKHRVAEFIDLVGLSGFENAYPHQVSGGMAQRVAIARALINEPKALLLDEPMGALDSFTRIELQDKLLDLWSSLGSTMLLVTHDVDEAVYLSDRIVIMTPRPGRISEIIEVGIGRPRSRNDPDFLRLRSTILETLHLAGSKPEPEFSI